MEENKMESIKIYPSNWLYNAGVVGFLKVIESNHDTDVAKGWLQDDGTVTIDRDIFSPIKIKNQDLPKCIKKLTDYLVIDTNIDEWLNKADKHEQGKTYRDKYKDFYEKMGDFGYKFIQAGNKLFASKTPYQNFVQLGEWQSFEFINIVSSLAQYGKKKSDLICGLCGSNSAKRPDTNSKLEKRLFAFQESHMRVLAPSIGEFPNAFWNLNDSFIICPLCAYLTLHRHIPWINTQNGQIFINAPSFKVMWHLNRFAEQILSKHRSYQVREILGISFMELAQRVSVTLGTWSMMNIEIVIKRYNQDKKKEEIEYYSLPYEISRVLLQKEIASLINETKEPLILETILNGNFDYLLTLSHKVLRYSVTGSNAFNDKYLSQLRNKDPYSLKILSRILPELYVKINSTINREVMI